MPQADNVVTFPLDRLTTDLLQDYIGSPVARIGEAAVRLEALDTIAFVLRTSHEVKNPDSVRAVLLGIEILAQDCMRCLELQPLEVAA